MIEKPYKHIEYGSDGKPYISGPGSGMSRDSGALYPEMRFTTLAYAKAGALCANEGYLTGYKHAQYDIRKALGINDA